MKKFISLILLLTFALGVKAEMLYLVKSGKEITPSVSIKMVYISGDKLLTLTKKANEISSKLYSNPSYWEDKMYNMIQKNYDNKYMYDPNMSTSKYEVYKTKRRGPNTVEFTSYGYHEFPGSVIGYNYLGVATDGKTCVIWYQLNSPNDVRGTEYYEVVDPDILNKDPHDFLK